jgi:GTP-binding protein Era
MRYGTVAIIGRSNVGKSTFLNSALGMPLAIVSRLPQTTRDTLLGVVTSEGVQLAFVDTPGLHKPKNELGRRMNHEAIESLRNADAALFMTDSLDLESLTAAAEGSKKATKPAAAKTAKTAKKKAAGKAGSAGRPRSRGTSADLSDAELIAQLPSDLPTVLVLNKIDRVRDKAKLLPVLQAFNARHPFAAVVPISARNGDGVDLVLAEVAKLVPEQEARFGADDVTDRPVAFFAREYIREQVLAMASREVPHAVAVTIDSFEESTTGMHVSATVHVEKVGQRAILVGRGGAMIREIGKAARARLMELTEQPVHLKLFVRVTERWRDVPRQLAELGYSEQSS